jgi:tetratricopeptide (TPR) repeat protein
VHLLEDTGDKRALAHASYMLAGAHVQLGDMDAASELSERALALYEELGDLTGAATVLNNSAIDHYLVGEWEACARLLERSRQIRKDLGDVVLTAESELNLGELRSDQGHFEEAEGLLRDALAIFRAAPRPEGIGMATSNLGRLAARRGRTDEGVALLREARELFERIGAGALALEAEVREAEALSLGGRAVDALQAAEATIARAESLPEGRFYLATVERAAARATADLGDRDGARRRFSRALDLAREQGSPYDEALALRGLGALEADPKAEARAREVLRDLGVIGA